MRPLATQETYPWRATIRTGLQLILGLVLAAPLIIREAGVDQTLPIVVGILGISAGAARLMAIPEVNALLTRIGLGAEPKTPGDDPGIL